MSEPTVEPRATTPLYGWHVPVLGDVPNVPADLTALATGIESTFKDIGSFCLCSGVHGSTLPAAAWTQINLQSILVQRSRLPFTLSGGALLAPYAGTYLIIHATQLTGSATNLRAGRGNNNDTAFSEVPGNVGFKGFLQSVGVMTAGQAFEKPSAYASSSIAAPTGNLWVVYLGKSS